MRPLTALIEQACRMEVSARKPGNVHPEASFADLTAEHFLRSAVVASLWLARAAELGVGPAIERAVHATHEAVGTNTNLGIALLIAPLAAVPGEQSLEEGIEGLLNSLTVGDAAAVYRAIRTANPGGLGTSDTEDVRAEPSRPLREVMQLSADFDLIGRQYANSFQDLLIFGRQELKHWWETTGNQWETAIIGLHLSLMARYPDSLIGRKCGAAVAVESQRRAQEVLQAGWPDHPAGGQKVLEFDLWLRSDGHRRNPGTTADLVAGVLFATLRDRLIDFPPVGDDVAALVPPVVTAEARREK